MNWYKVLENEVEKITQRSLFLIRQVKGDKMDLHMYLLRNDLKVSYDNIPSKVCGPLLQKENIRICM